MTAEIVDFQQRLTDRRMEKARFFTGLSPHEIALIANLAMPQEVREKVVADFTRACEQTGLIDNLRKE